MQLRILFLVAQPRLFLFLPVFVPAQTGSLHSVPFPIPGEIFCAISRPFYPFFCLLGRAIHLLIDLSLRWDCCMGVSLNSFAAELILSVFGKDQTSGIWTSSKQKFPQVSIREVLLSSSNRREIRNDCRLILASCTMQDAIVNWFLLPARCRTRLSADSCFLHDAGRDCQLILLPSMR